MFYALFVIAFLTIFFLAFQNKKRHTIIFSIVLISYFLAISSMMIYYSKDTYYNNIIKNYFYLPESIWRQLFFLPISRFNVIRVMNFFSLSTVLSSIYFAFCFRTPFSVKTIRTLKIIITVYLGFQLLIYDPQINLKSYYFLYPDYMTVADFNTLTSIIHIITRWGNCILMLCCVLILLIAYLHFPRIRVIRNYYLLMTMCFLILSGIYLIFISPTPAFLLRISKFADSYHFWHIDLGGDLFIYRIFPYILVLSLLLICYSLYRLAQINRQIEREEFEIVKQIDATETTSKIFCHYIKNELLAIQAELELLSISDNTTSAISSTVVRCQKLYKRIDEIHKSTKTNELHLMDVILQNILDEILLSIQESQIKLNIRRSYPSEPIIVLADPTYLEQALHNIILNAVEAMVKKPPKERILTVQLQSMEDWHLIEIKDTGTGISSSNLGKIFTPFFSSKPVNHHWGMGLSLSHRIIHAHEGKIQVQSQLGEGTVFQILLPKITQIFRNGSQVYGKD